MSIKRFETAAKQKKVETEGTPFEIPDRAVEGKDQTYRKLVAFQPGEGQFAMLLADVGRGTSEAQKIAGFINFCMAIMDASSADYLAGRLLDRDDDFEVEDMQAIMEWLTEEWSGNPTQEPSGSAQSPSHDGPSSTPPTPQSTF